MCISVITHVIGKCGHEITHEVQTLDCDNKDSGNCAFLELNPSRSIETDCFPCKEAKKLAEEEERKKATRL
jgi:hypothetical protein